MIPSPSLPSEFLVLVNIYLKLSLKLGVKLYLQQYTWESKRNLVILRGTWNITCIEGIIRLRKSGQEPQLFRKGTYFLGRKRHLGVGQGRQVQRGAMKSKG